MARTCAQNGRQTSHKTSSEMVTNRWRKETRSTKKELEDNSYRGSKEAKHWIRMRPSRWQETEGRGTAVLPSVLHARGGTKVRIDHDENQYYSQLQPTNELLLTTLEAA